MSIRKKVDIWFWSTANEDLLMEEIEEKPVEAYESPFLTRGGEEQIEMADPDHDVLRDEVSRNREMINDVRVRMNRVDERTAFMSKILFGVFVSIFTGVAAGLILAFFI